MNLLLHIFVFITVIHTTIGDDDIVKSDAEAAADAIEMKKKTLLNQISGILTQITVYVQKIPKFGETLGNWMQDLKMKFTVEQLTAIKEALLKEYSSTLTKIADKGAPLFDFEAEYQKELIKRELQGIEDTVTRYWLNMTGNVFSKEEMAKIIFDRKSELDVLKRVHSIDEMEEIKSKYYEVHGALLKRLKKKQGKTDGLERDWNNHEGPALEAMYRDGGVVVQDGMKPRIAESN